MAASSSDAPADKRRRLDLARTIAGTGLSMARQAEGHGIHVHDAKSEIHKHDNVNTPFGSLYIDLVVGDLAVHCLNPFAMLWFVSQTKHTAQFLAKHLSSGVCRIAFYCDGVKPGNTLRPDIARTFEAIYWTFFELPAWFRHNASASWFPLCFIQSRDLKSVSGGMAAVAKSVVKLFFPQDKELFNFMTTGVFVGTSPDQVHIRASFGCWLGDEKAIKEVVSCKGASGFKPCVCCKNVVNRMEGSAELVHISCPDIALFDRQSPESIAYMATDLAAKHGVVSRADFEFLQKAYGINFCESAIIFDEYCRDVVRFPDSIYWDWMHCLLSSGGVAQYNVNYLCLELVNSGTSLENIDTFASEVSWPSSRPRLQKTFFQERTVNGDGHIRAFASEMLGVISVLGLFLDVVVKPVGVLKPHTDCFDVLRRIIAMLLLGDAVAAATDELQRLARMHHEAFDAVYPGCIKPKMHYLKHAIECIGKHRVNLSCFGPERRHKDAKTIAAFSYKNVGKAMLTRIMYDWVNVMQDANTFTMHAMGPKVKLPGWAADLVSAVAGVPTVVSNSIHVKGCGAIKSNDFVRLLNPDRLAKVRFAVVVDNGDGSQKFYIVVDVFAQDVDGVWSTRVTCTTLVEPMAVSNTCCYVKVGDVFYV